MRGVSPEVSIKICCSLSLEESTPHLPSHRWICDQSLWSTDERISYLAWQSRLSSAWLGVQTTNYAPIRLGQAALPQLSWISLFYFCAIPLFFRHTQQVSVAVQKGLWPSFHLITLMPDTCVNMAKDKKEPCSHRCLALYSHIHLVCMPEEGHRLNACRNKLMIAQRCEYAVAVFVF